MGVALMLNLNFVDLGHKTIMKGDNAKTTTAFSLLFFIVSRDAPRRSMS
jgi:hypothetical protein